MIAAILFSSALFEWEILWVNDETGIFQLPNPYEYALGANGDLYLLNKKDNTVLVMDDSGVVYKKIGSRGSGPGEFSAANRIFLMNQTNDVSKSPTVNTEAILK